MVKSQQAALQVLGYQVSASKSRPGQFQWLLDGGKGGASAAFFESEELAWAEDVAVQEQAEVVAKS